MSIRRLIPVIIISALTACFEPVLAQTVFVTKQDRTNISNLQQSAIAITNRAISINGETNRLNSDVNFNLTPEKIRAVNITNGTASNLSVYVSLRLNGTNVLTAEGDTNALAKLADYARTNQVTRIFSDSGTVYKIENDVFYKAVLSTNYIRAFSNQYAGVLIWDGYGTSFSNASYSMRLVNIPPNPTYWSLRTGFEGYQNTFGQFTDTNILFEALGEVP